MSHWSGLKRRFFTLSNAYRHHEKALNVGFQHQVMIIMISRVSHKKQSSFLWPGHLNLAVSVYKEAKYQNSDFYLKNWPSAA